MTDSNAESEKLKNLLNDDSSLSDNENLTTKSRGIDSFLIFVGWFHIVLGFLNLVLMKPLYSVCTRSSAYVGCIKEELTEFGVGMGIGGFIVFIITGVFFLALARIIELLKK